MQYFTLQAESHREAMEKMKRQYGERARILTFKNLRTGGLLGLFKKEGVEITGYVSNSVLQTQKKKVQQEKQKILDSVKREQTLDILLKEVQALKNSIEETDHQSRDEHPSLKKMRDLLLYNAFAPDYIDTTLTRARKEFSLEALQDFSSFQQKVIEWIGEDISIYPSMKIGNDEPKIFILVGPTGVGKTTTIAKIAAIYGISNGEFPEKKVRIVTIDNYRIAARQQIKTYGDIMRIPVSSVETAADLRKIIALYQDVEVILIDTIGKNPRDYEKLGEMKGILDVCGRQSETHLAVSATTKSHDIEDILRQFEPFRYKSVVLTKLDETSKIGNILSVLRKTTKPISYITDGQAVPQDIEEATVVRLLMNLEGFRINRELLEKKFGICKTNLKNIWS